MLTTNVAIPPYSHSTMGRAQAPLPDKETNPVSQRRKDPTPWQISCRAYWGFRPQEAMALSQAVGARCQC